ncbi:MAG: sigma-70 family RNA polymerase sigma factor [Actinomycetota bacterium]
MSETMNSSDITLVLKAWSSGKKESADELFPLVYDELKRQARIFLSRERSDHTLQPTALVHEAYLKLIDQNRVDWQNRAHFFGVAATLMRRILVDYAREHAAGKRGGAAQRLSIDDVDISVEQYATDLLELNTALEKLAEIDERKATVVEMRFFAGLNEKEIAEVLEVSEKTVRRDWNFARLWLFRELSQTSI